MVSLSFSLCVPRVILAPFLASLATTLFHQKRETFLNTRNMNASRFSDAYVNWCTCNSHKHTHVYGNGILVTRVRRSLFTNILFGVIIPCHIDACLSTGRIQCDYLPAFVDHKTRLMFRPSPLDICLSVLQPSVLHFTNICSSATAYILSDVVKYREIVFLGYCLSLQRHWFWSGL